MQSVALIGNAKSLFATEHGQRIDSFDKVYRINMGCKILNEKSHGTKIDIAYMSVPIIFKDILHEVTVPIYHVSNFGRPSQNVQGYIPTESNKKCAAEVGVDRPSCGLMVLYWLLNNTNDNITLFGFDFKATPTFYDTHRKNEPHDYVKEKEYILNLIETNENCNIQLDV